MTEHPEIGTLLPSPGEPTEALPGTETKIQILIARAARREPLFHPYDGPRARLRRKAPLLVQPSLPKPVSSPEAAMPLTGVPVQAEQADTVLVTS